MDNIININTYALKSPRKAKIGRPVNCFMAFRLEKHREISSQTPGLNHRDISKIIAKWWKEMTEEEKAPYRAIAAKAKADHELRYPNYTYKPIKKSQRRVRPYHRREDEATRQRKAQKNELKLKPWLGEGSTPAPYLSPSTSTTSIIQNSPTSSFSGTDFNSSPPFIPSTHVDHDLSLFTPDPFSLCGPIAYDPSLSFDLDTPFFTGCDSFFSNPVELSAWISSVNVPTTTMPTPGLLSLANFLQS
ncbi:unnamed protein product [Absidia cylindrospora]